MNCLLRKIKRDSEGTAYAVDRELQSDRLSIGSRFDQDIQVFGEGIKESHGQAEYQSGKDLLKINCHRRATVIFQGQTVTHCQLGIGDEIQLDSWTLRRIAAPPGFDLAIAVEAGESLGGGEGAAAAQYPFESKLPVTGVNLHKLSYALLLVILLAGFAFPFLSQTSDGVRSPVKRSLVKQLHLPDDAFWSSGPLANAHQIPELSSNCNSCHVKNFQMVQDDVCTACHTANADHVSIQHRGLPAPEIGKCSSCHKEHNEPAQIVATDNSLCVDCHQDIGAGKDIGAEKVQAVSGFSIENHPQFRLSLLRPPGLETSGRWHSERARHGSTPVEETSGLKFTHQIHMDKNKVQSVSSGQGLACNDCHQLSSDKEHFLPITMESSCKDCHSLSFDTPNPLRELPHGNPELVITMMEEYFTRYFAKAETESRDPPPWRRRIPGRTYDYLQCDKSVFFCGQQQAMLEAEDQFAITGCVTCHQITEQAGAPLAQRWQVQPVKLAGDWYPYSRFNHQSHLVSSANSMDEQCDNCHQAADSNTSADILIPGIESCDSCHGEHQQTAITLQCTGCHDFHYREMSAIPSNKALDGYFHTLINE